MPRQITAFSNPLVKQARSLRDKKNRRAEGLFLAEGLRILTEAREAGVLPERLFFSDASHPLLQALIDETEAAGGEAIETSADILHKISGKENPQAALGVYRAFDTASIASTGARRRSGSSPRRCATPAISARSCRTGDAVGAGGLILIDDCADPFSAEAVRASMGALFTQRIAAARWETFVPWLRSGPGQLIGTSLDAPRTIRRRATQSPPSSWSATSRPGCPTPMRPNATCSSRCRCWARPTASTPRWRRR